MIRHKYPSLYFVHISVGEPGLFEGARAGAGKYLSGARPFLKEPEQELVKKL